MIRSLCQEFQPNWIHQPPAIPNDWSICEHILEGHTDWNTTVDYSPDGKLLASASADGTIRIWRTDTGICDQVLEGHGSTVMSAAFSPDGSRIVSGCDTGDIWVWRATQGAYRFERVLIKHEASTRSVAFSSDGTRLAASFNDGTVRIWRSNARFYEHEQTFGDHGKATSNGQESLATYLTFSSDGGRLAVAFLDGPVEIWRADDAAYKFERCFQGTAMFPAVAFSPDGSNLALGLTENNIHIFRLDTWTHEHILKVDTDDIDVLAFSPDGKWLVCGSRSIYIWRIEAGCYGLEQTLKGVSGIQTTSLAFSPDSAWLASTSQNKDVRIWRIDTGNHDNEIEGDLLMICSVTFSPDGLRLASASHDGLIRIWGVQTGVCERIIDDSDSIGPQVAFSSDGLRFASSHMKGDIRIWRVRDWVHEQLFNVGETGNRISLAFSPGGTCLAVVYSDCHVMILQIETGVCVQRFMTTCDLIRAIAFSPDGARLALASSKFRNGCQSWTIQVWRLSTESCVQKLQIYHHDNWVDEKRMTFSPDGQQLRTAQSAMRIFPSKVPEVYYGGFDVSKDRRWITWNGTPILWLPADYQGAYSAVSGSRIALGLDSGRVITLALDPQLMDALLAQVNLQQSSREEWEKGIFDVSLPNESLDAEEGSEEDGESYEEGGSDEEGVSDEVGHYHEY